MPHAIIFPPTHASRWTVQWRAQVDGLLHERSFFARFEAEAFAASITSSPTEGDQ